MQINSSWIALAFIIVPAAFTTPELTETFAHADAVRQENKAAELDRQGDIREAENAKADSEVALTRVGAGCIPVVTAGTLEDTRLAENVPVQVRDGTNRSFDDGTFVCTKLGDTGEVYGGRVFQVKRIAPEHKAQYDEVYGKL